MAAVEKLVLDTKFIRQPVGSRVDVREHAAVEAAGGVQAVDESGVCVVALALRRIAAEPPHRNGERNPEQQQRGKEPERTAPGARCRPG